MPRPPKVDAHWAMNRPELRQRLGVRWVPVHRSRASVATCARRNGKHVEKIVCCRWTVEGGRGEGTHRFGFAAQPAGQILAADRSGSWKATFRFGHALGP